MLPPSRSFISSIPMPGLMRSAAVAAITMPGMQYPHWLAPALWKARCTTDSSPPSVRLSTVSIRRPCALPTGRRQDLTRTPSTNTEQVPHSPAPQPSLVPVRCRSSRRKSSSRRCGAAFRLILRPLTVASICRSGITFLQGRNERVGVAPRVFGGFEKSPHDEPLQHAAAVGLAATRLHQSAGSLRRFLDALGGDRLAAKYVLRLVIADRDWPYPADADTHILETAQRRIEPDNGGDAGDGD